MHSACPMTPISALTCSKYRRCFSFWAVLLGIALLFCSSLAARERCGVEAKLLVSSIDLHRSLAVLHAVSESHGEVYLFDTDGLELLSQGVILRLRMGADADLTVKMRSSEAVELKDFSEAGERFKCEIDLVGNAALTSHFLRAAWKSRQIPRTGEELRAALSPGQLKLLTAGRISIDWHRVKRIAQIQATDWEVRTDGPPRKVTVELWEWSNGKILELSAKTDPQRGASTMGQLRDRAVANGLMIEKNQEPKTSLVLHALRPAP